jgi:trigger factor
MAWIASAESPAEQPFSPGANLTLRRAEPTVRGSIRRVGLCGARFTLKERYCVNVTVTDLGPCKKQVRIEIAATEVDAALDEVGKEYCKHVSLPGFRPGKTPKAMVLKKHEADIRDEARRKLINEHYKKAMEEQKLEVIGQPEIEEIGTEGVKAGTEFVFLATVEIEPSFELPEYKGLSVKRPSAAVSDEEVSAKVDLLRGKHATFETVTREARPGDVAVVNYSGTCDGKPITETAPAAKGLTEQKGFWISMEPGGFLPGFSEQLTGTKAGDKLTVNVQFPEDFNPKPLAGKQAAYEVEVVEVRERKLPELTEELAKQWGAESLEKLREGVRRDLENEAKYRQTREVRGQLVQALISKLTFDLPESAVATETKHVVYDIVRENSQRGIPKEVIDQQKEQIYSAAANSAKDNVRLSFLVQRIAEKEEIKIGNEELNRRIIAMATVYQIPVQKFVKDLQKRNGFIEIYDQLQREKVLALLEQHAVIEEVPASTT